MEDVWTGWRFLHSGGRISEICTTQLQVGQTIEVMPEWRHAGRMMACGDILDALWQFPEPVACRVQLKGNLETRWRMTSGDSMTILNMVDATSVIHEFAWWCANRVFDMGRDRLADVAPLIEAKRRWLDGEWSDDQLDDALANAQRLDLDMNSPLPRSVARKAVFTSAFRQIQAVIGSTHHAVEAMSKLDVISSEDGCRRYRDVNVAMDEFRLKCGDKLLSLVTQSVLDD